MCMMCSLIASATSLNTDKSPLLSYNFSRPYFEKINHDGNIKNDIVTVGVQANNGIVWLGTQNGLVSFDGYQYNTYSHDPKNINSLSGDFIVGLGEQTNGDLWIATRSSGLTKFEVDNLVFRRFQNVTGGNTISSNTLRALLVSKDDSIWVGSDTGVDHLNKYGELIKHYTIPGSKKSITYSIFQLENGNILVGGTFGAAIIKQDEIALIKTLSHLDVRNFAIDATKHIWLSTHEGLYIWDQNTNLFTPSGIDPSNNKAYFRRVVVTDDGKIWAATYGSGLWLFDEQEKKLLRTFTHDPSDNSSLIFNDIGWIFPDNSQNLWIGTWGAGLQRLNLYLTQYFSTIRYSTSDPKGLSFPNIRSVYELDDGRWLFGTSGEGIDIFDPKFGKIGNISHQNLGETLSYIVSITQDKQGNIWAGSQTDGLYKIDLSTMKANKVEIKELIADSIFRLLTLRSGKVVVSTSKEVCILDTQTLECTQILLPGNKPLLDSSTRLYEDSFNNLWVGTHKGLLRKRPNSNIFDVFSVDTSNLSNNYVQGIIEDNDRLLVVTSTSLDELKFHNSELPKISSLNTLYEFGDGRTGGNMVFDKKGRLWSAASFLDFSEKKLYGVDVENGINIGTMWLGSYTKLTNGHFLFGGTKGVLIVKPDDYIPKLPKSNIITRSIVIDGLKTKRPSNNIVIMEPGQNNLNIQVAAIDLINRKNIAYEYQIREISENWLELEKSSRWIGLTNLEPFEHNLEVRGRYIDNSGEIEPLHIKIIVKPTFFQTIYFKLLLLVVLSAFLFMFYKFRINQLKQRAERLELMVAQKSSELITINNIGKEFTSHLSLDEVFQEIYLQVSSILTADTFGIGLVNESRHTLVFEYSTQQGKRFKTYERNLHKEEQLAVYSVVNNKTVLVNDYDQEYIQFNGLKDETALNLDDGTLSTKTQSMIYVPIRLHNKPIGIMGLQSFKKDSYTNADVTIVETLASYAAIALNNAKAHEDLIQLHQELETSLETLRLTQDKLVMREKMAALGQLVAGVAHEVNTPLGVSITAISVLDEKLEHISSALNQNLLKKQDLEEFISSSRSSIDLALPNLARTANLVQQFKKVASSKDGSSIEQIKLPDLYIDTVTVSKESTKSHVEISVVNQEIVILYSLPSKIIQVITIIVENAITHAFNGIDQPTISLSYRCDEKYLITSIEDNGVGIPIDVLEKIFEPFYTTKRQMGLTGLGLTIAFNIVTQDLKGTLSCSSVLGQGTRFEIKFPKQLNIE